MIDQQSELKNELTDLKDSISDIMAVIAFQDMRLNRSIHYMKNQMLDRF